MSESPKKYSRRTVLGALVASVLGADIADAQQKGKKQNKSAPKAENFRENADYRPIFDYMRMLNTTKAFESGSPEEIIQLCRHAALGGARPDVPEYKSARGRGWYPEFLNKAWPVLQFFTHGESRKESERDLGSVAISVRNGLRVGQNRVLLPRLIGGNKPIHGINAEIFTASLRGNDAAAPIHELLPEVPDAEIQRGRYAVAIGKSSPGFDHPNYDEATGNYHLTGFLIPIRGAGALRSLFEKHVRNMMPVDRIDEYLAVVDASYVMIGQRYEWEAFLERAVGEADGCGQAVYVSDAKKGFRRMGMMHHFGYLTADGSRLDIVKTADGIAIRGGKEFAPIYLVHGRQALEKLTK